MCVQLIFYVNNENDLCIREREIVEELTTPNKRALVQDWWVELLYYYNYNATFTLSKLDRGL